MDFIAVLVVCLAAYDPDFGWINSPRMHNPKLTEVVVAAIPEADCEIQIECDSGLESPVLVARGGELFQYTVIGLDSGCVVSATVRARPLNTEGWLDESTLELRTLKPAGMPVRFGIAADTHAWALYSRWVNGLDALDKYGTMQAAIDNLANDRELDFVMAMTDSAMTQCGSGCAPVGMPGGSTSESSVTSISDARFRYRAVWSELMLGRIAAAVPVFVMNGDHEGEAGYQGTQTNSWSSSARLATIPPFAGMVIPGPPETLAYAIESGPLLLVALDVHTHTERFPTSPDHWHLGAEQHIWLAEVLGSSRKPWKIVMAEHLVGGLGDPQGAIWKGRGGITATDDGTPTGSFLGEQALVHATMLATGGDVFLSAHDHVVAWGLKDGVGYLIAGRAGGVSNPWTAAPWYSSAMDYDDDGVPEYESGITGTKLPGCLIIEADDTSLQITYRRASTDNAHNNEPVLEFALTH